MKSSAIILRQDLRALTTKRKVPVTIVALGLLVGSLVFFRSTPNLSRDPTLAPPEAPPPTIKKNPDEVTDSATTNAVTSLPAIPAADQPPSPTPPDTSVSSTTVEIVLPSAPSGDYELNLTAEQIVAIVEKRYGGLFQSLNLTPEQLIRLRSFLVERQQLAADAANAALLAGVNPVRELSTIRNAIEQAQAPIDTTLRNELGEAVFVACREFDRTLSERNSAGDLARLFAATGDPLRPDQEKNMAQIFKKFPGKAIPVDIDRAIYGEINTRAPISEQAVTAAATVLSPRQLELLRQLAAGTPHR